MYKPKRITKIAATRRKPAIGKPIFLAAIEPVKPTIAPMRQ